MKKLLISLAFLVISSVFCFATEVTIQPVGNEESQLSQSDFSIHNVNIVFRGNQKVRSSDGVEIYFYTSGTCKWFDNDRFKFSCTYNISGNEVYFYESDGSLAYKGRINWNESHSKPLSIVISGKTFRNVN